MRSDNIDRIAPSLHMRSDNIDRIAPSLHMRSDNIDRIATSLHTRSDTATGSPQVCTCAVTTSTGSPQVCTCAVTTSTGSHQVCTRAVTTSTGSPKVCTCAVTTLTGSPLVCTCAVTQTPPSRPNAAVFSFRNNENVSHSEVQYLIQTQLDVHVRSIQFDPLDIRSARPGSTPAGSSKFVLQRIWQKLYSRGFKWARTGWCSTRMMTSLHAKQRPIETTWGLLTLMQ
ncbi:uncharacterized protein LOC127835109 [Dreissena polymorpha]|uniref:uncharacterized protein LOC127835109 n=1 Tax=Dreissena polymorpha TaxID=45954 RepID=UPI002264B358|nr:uncharacterized protein LOC127835109 [Dreissena polymorpha]